MLSHISLDKKKKHLQNLQKLFIFQKISFVQHHRTYKT